MMNRLNKVKLWLSEKLTPQGYTIVEKEFEHGNVPVPPLDRIPSKIPDNTVTVQNQPNTHHTKEEEGGGQTEQAQTLRRGTKIIYGENPKTGQIRKGANGMYVYVYSTEHQAIYRRKCTIEQGKQFIKTFNERGCPYNQLKEMGNELLQQSTHTSCVRKNKYRHILKYSDSQYVIRHARVHFGVVRTEKQALHVVKFLIYKNWDTQYKSTNIQPGKKRIRNYYLSLLPHMCTNEFEEWLKENDESITETLRFGGNYE